MGKKSKQARREAKLLRRMEKQGHHPQLHRFTEASYEILPGVSQRIKEKYRERDRSLQDIIGLDRTQAAKDQLKELTGKMRIRNDIIVIPPFLREELRSLLDSSDLRVIILPSIISPAVVRSH